MYGLDPWNQPELFECDICGEAGEEWDEGPIAFTENDVVGCWKCGRVICKNCSDDNVILCQDCGKMFCERHGCVCHDCVETVFEDGLDVMKGWCTSCNDKCKVVEKGACARCELLEGDFEGKKEAVVGSGKHGSAHAYVLLLQEQTDKRNKKLKLYIMAPQYYGYRRMFKHVGWPAELSIGAVKCMDMGDRGVGFLIKELEESPNYRAIPIERWGKMYDGVTATVRDYSWLDAYSTFATGKKHGEYSISETSRDEMTIGEFVKGKANVVQIDDLADAYNGEMDADVDSGNEKAKAYVLLTEEQTGKRNKRVALYIMAPQMHGGRKLFVYRGNRNQVDMGTAVCEDTGEFGVYPLISGIERNHHFQPVERKDWGRSEKGIVAIAEAYSWLDKYGGKPPVVDTRDKHEILADMRGDMVEDLAGAYGGKMETIIRPHLVGGLGDIFQPSQVDQKQLKMGIEVEKEHSYIPKVAQKIAIDHLVEIPDYYDRLEEMEDKAKEEGMFHGEMNQAAPHSIPVKGLVEVYALLSSASSRLSSSIDNAWGGDVSTDDAEEAIYHLNAALKVLKTADEDDFEASVEKIRKEVIKAYTPDDMGSVVEDLEHLLDAMMDKIEGKRGD